MKYVLELTDLGSNGLSAEEVSRITSESPIVVPMVGDQIGFMRVSECYYVVNREFTYYTDDDDVVCHIQVLCEDEAAHKQRQAAAR